MMPSQGGYELVRGLQATEQRAIPVVMVTGRKLDESTKEMFRREGNVVEVLAKPLPLNIFALTLHKVLGTKPPQK
jgi:CheY-like chemotaxis protein